MQDTLIYLDHAATTPVRPEVREAMLPYLGGDLFGNPSSGHRHGRAVRAGVEQARRQVAEALGVAPPEVVFTSGGTEADNLAVIGAALHSRSLNRPMVAAVAASEHKAILASAHEVEHLGGEAIILAVDPDGLLDLDALEAALRRQPAVVSVMWVNNETGVIQPIAEIAARCHAAGVQFHSDLVPAFGKVPLDLAPLDLASVSAHKIGGPKGVGALIVREGAAIEPLQHGGSQQRAVRPGTENVAGIIGMGCAAALASQERVEEQGRLTLLRDDLLARIRATIPDVHVTGEKAPRAPHILNLQLPGVEVDALLAQLDLAGVAASSGSACTTGSVEPSHVLTAMRVPRDRAVAAIRLSLGRTTTAQEIERAAAVLTHEVARSRKLALALGRA